MKWLVRILVALVLIVGAAALVSFFLPGSVQVSRSIIIEAPPETVFPYVNDLRRANEWSPWFARDPDMQQTISGPDGGVGQSLSWVSEDPQVGSGSQTIVESIENERVEVDLDFGEMGTADAAFELEPAGEATEVTWSFSTDLGYNPVFRYMGLMFDRWVGTDFETGLASLKELVESESGAEN